MIRPLLASVPTTYLAAIAILGLTAAPIETQTSDARSAEKRRPCGDA